MTALYRLAEKKCATCRWWNGPRGIELLINISYYVKISNSAANCIAKGNRSSTVTNTCLGWPIWDKLM